MITAYTDIDRAALETDVATDLAQWANLLVEVLAQVEHTPVTADLVCSSDHDARLYNSLTELGEHGGRIDAGQLHAALPILLRPLLGAPAAGYPRLTDLLAAALELITRADAAWAITTATGGAEPDHPDRIGGNVGAHLQFAASVLRQAATEIQERTKA
ncbi:hypothetical protein [Nocardia amamiensis]|uniref:hypothetical protein n=1 Tax=Nocardia amamiensis TaxID=404578 RepID=UPI000836B3B6|nr:hypothetical protein [Nocardia amamiensis]